MFKLVIVLVVLLLSMVNINASLASTITKALGSMMAKNGGMKIILY